MKRSFRSQLFTYWKREVFSLYTRCLVIYLNPIFRKKNLNVLKSIVREIFSPGMTVSSTDGGLENLNSKKTLRYLSRQKSKKKNIIFKIYLFSEIMTRIDPKQLLSTLSVLLAPDGGIRSVEEVNNYAFLRHINALFFLLHH